MTNHKLIEKFRALNDRVGVLVPYTLAHKFAGVTPQRLWWLRKNGRLQIETFENEAFLALASIEARNTKGGKPGILERLVRHQAELFEAGTLFACFRIPRFKRAKKRALRRRRRVTS